MFSTAFKTKATSTEVIQVSIHDIDPCPYQPRKLMNKQALSDLSENIKENGILQPLTATKLENGRYQLIAGHRRLLAATKAELKTVPVIVLNKSEEDIAVLSVIENLQREDLNFFEQALAIQSLMTNLNLTQTEVGKKLSISQPAVANKLKLLQFTKEQQMKMLAFNLTERHARAISRLPVEKQNKAIDYIIANNLNVSATDKYINNILTPKKTHKQKTIINIRDIRLFTNTVKKAVNVMKSAGVNADYTQNEDDKSFYYQIVVPKQYSK